MQCRLLDTGYNDCYTNMAVDEALMKLCDCPILRVYAWRPAAVSLGHNQQISDISQEACKKNNIKIVRRITGGKAILHDNEVTYSFVAPEDAGIVPRDIIASYKAISEALVEAFGEIGIKVKIKKQAERNKNPICLLAANWYEIIANEKKICGSAQRRANGKIFQHGSIIIDFDYKKNIELFKTKNTENDLRKRITSIKNEIHKEISYSQLSIALQNGFREKFGLEITQSIMMEKEKKLVEKLIDEKYKKDKWNYFGRV